VDFREALRRYVEVNSKDGTAHCVEALARALLALNGARDATTAVRLCGLAKELRHGEPPLRPPSEQIYYEQALALGCACLGDNQFAAAWTAGASQAGDDLKWITAALD